MSADKQTEDFNVSDASTCYLSERQLALSLLVLVRACESGNRTAVIKNTAAAKNLLVQSGYINPIRDNVKAHIPHTGAV